MSPGAPSAVSAGWCVTGSAAASPGTALLPPIGFDDMLSSLFPFDLPEDAGLRRMARILCLGLITLAPPCSPPPPIALMLLPGSWWTLQVLHRTVSGTAPR